MANLKNGKMEKWKNGKNKIWKFIFYMMINNPLMKS